MRLNEAKAHSLAATVIHTMMSEQAARQLNQAHEAWVESFNQFSENLETSFNQQPSQFLLNLRTQLLNRECFDCHGQGYGTLKVFTTPYAVSSDGITFLPPPDKKYPNLQMDVFHLFGRGLDVARATIEILNYLPSGKQKHEDVKTALQIFHRRMAIAAAEKDKLAACKLARAELAKFQGALSVLLVESGIGATPEGARSAINFMRDFLWKRFLQDKIYCMVMPNRKKGLETSTGLLLHVAKPLNVEHLAGQSPWKNKQARWRAHLRKKCGAWINQFLDENLDTLEHLCMPPSTRSVPNPANAFDTSFIAVRHYAAKQEVQIEHVLNEIHNSTTEPHEVEESDEKTALTMVNHSNLIIGGDNHERLKEIIADYFNRWQGVDDKADVKSVEIPLLHQTLIGDRILPWPFAYLIPDYYKSSTMLTNKAVANEALRVWFKEHEIYYHRRTQEVLIRKKQTHNVALDHNVFCEVNVKLLETNNCVNQHHKYSGIRNEDVLHSRELVNFAAGQLTKLLVSLAGSERNINVLREQIMVVVNFLNSSDYSWFTPYKHRGTEVKRALRLLNTILLRSDNADLLPNVPHHTLKNFVLLAQAATELKCTVHETRLGALRRMFNNGIDALVDKTTSFLEKIPYLGKSMVLTKPVWYRDGNFWLKFATGIACGALCAVSPLGLFGVSIVAGKLMFAVGVAGFAAILPVVPALTSAVKIAGAALKAAGFVAAQAIKLLPLGIPAVIGIWHWLKHESTSRKTVFKSVFERIVAGNDFGGCMSAVDRKPMIDRLVAAQIQNFAERGRLVGLNDEPHEKTAFLRPYSDSASTHFFNYWAYAGLATTADYENRSHIDESGVPPDYETDEEIQLSYEMWAVRKGECEFPENEAGDYDSRAYIKKNSSTGVLHRRLANPAPVRYISNLGPSILPAASSVAAPQASMVSTSTAGSESFVSARSRQSTTQPSTPSVPASAAVVRQRRVIDTLFVTPPVGMRPEYHNGAVPHPVEENDTGAGVLSREQILAFRRDQADAADRQARGEAYGTVKGRIMYL